MRITLLFLLTVAMLLMSIASAPAACPLPFPAPACGNPGATVGDEIISMVYDPADGSLSLDAAGKQLTALEVFSTGGLFQGTKPPQAVGLFDLFTNKKLFVLKPTNPMGDEAFGKILPVGLTKEQIAADLIVSGALWPRGGLGTVDLVYVPEPNSTLAMIAVLGLASARGRRRYANESGA